MKVISKGIRFFGWTASIVLALSATILPAAVASTADDIYDIVEDLSLLKTGENFTQSCDATSDKADKRGSLNYATEDGHLKYVPADKAN